MERTARIAREPARPTASRASLGPGEWRWVMGMAALALLLTNLPCLIGLAQAQPGQPFTGVLLAREDIYSYYAKLRLGAGGAWAFQNVYAVEPHAGSLVYFPYLLLGKVAALGGGARAPLAAIAAVYHAARVLLSALYLAILYHVIALLLPGKAQRRLAWALAVYGGGLGWLAVLAGGDPLVLGGPIDLYLGEASAYLALVGLPHVLLARAALLGGLALLIHADVGGGWRRALAAGVCWLVAAAGVPFYTLVAAGVIGGWLAVRWARARAGAARLAGYALAAGAPAAVWNVVTLVQIAGDPVYASWNAQNRLPLLPLALLAAFGVQVTLALVGLAQVWRAAPPRLDLLAGWALAPPLLMLLPLPFQLRLVEGWYVPLGVLAACALVHLTARLPDRAARLLRGALVALMAGSFALVVLGASALALARSEPAFTDADTLAALGCLRERAPQGALVFAGERAGVMLPAAAPVRAVPGHGFETPDYARMAADARAFFGAGMDAAGRRAYLRRIAARYVFYGEQERALAAGAGAGQPFDAQQVGLRVACAAGRVVIYEVSP